MAEIRIYLPSIDYLETWHAGKRIRRENGFTIYKQKLRDMGAKHADLWANGSIYPKDPITGRPPEFKSISDLLKFACEGKLGLLGYCENMHKYINQICTQLQCCQFSIRKNDHSLKILEFQNSQLLEKIASLETSLCSMHNELCYKETTLLQMDSQLKCMRSKFNAAERNAKTLQSRLNRLKKTPQGYRERIRKSKPIEELKPTCGAARKRMLAIKQALNSKTDKKFVRKDVGNIVKSIASKAEILSLLSDPMNVGLQIGVLEMAMKEISDKINVEDVQAACDTIGISREGYRSLFKTFHEAIRSLGTKKVVIPRPYAIESIRKRRNLTVEEIFRKMYSIEAGHTPNLKGKKDSACDIIGLNERNNVWFDLEALLKFMVVYYNVYQANVEETLDICIKLDEMELTSQKKYERVSLVFMNYALSPDYAERGQLPKPERDVEWFLVQSEQHIWWLGMFQVRKENYEVLKWVMNLTDIPRLISLYEGGQRLEVEGHGSFKVRFHLAADLKTEKALYNVSSTPAQTSRNCIYCSYTLKKRTGQSISTLTCNQNLPPSRDKEDPKMDAVLPIPLERVHPCTLYAMVRIVEKMIHASCCFVWNMRNKKDRMEGIARVEKVLSDAGLHGGCVKLEQDTKTSSKSSRPAKVCLGGEKARKFLQQIDPKRILAERDRNDGANSALRKIEAWHAFSKLNLLLQKHSYSKEDVVEFKAKVTSFTRAYINAWGESEVTHYIHLLHAHGPWLAEKYGSLAIWNAQGMEKSHKQAKIAFHRSTQRGGNSTMSKPLHQMCEWFYRRLVARHERNNRRRKGASVAIDQVVVELRKRRRDVWMNSNARASLREWRAKRKSMGSKYVEI